MLGWEFYVTRQVGPVDPKAPGERIARWRAGLGGTRWVDGLVAGDLACDLGGNGYPMQYTVPAGLLLAILRLGPPTHDGPPVVGDDYFTPAGWTGDVSINLDRLASIDPREMILVEAWDQS